MSVFGSDQRKVKIAIAGALGRMGQALVSAVEARPNLEIVARFDRPDVTGPGLIPRDEALRAADVLIDFTTPEASIEHAQLCAKRGVALFSGATGLTGAQVSEIAKAAQRVGVVRTSNFSLGLNVMLGLVAQAAARLDAETWDIEIFEAHHRHKVDAPSGTALMLGEAAARGRGISLGMMSQRARDGITGERREGTIGFSVMRAGGIVGEHSVTFASEEEVLTFAHSARDRALFARGAAMAAEWINGKPAGLYDMQDVLGFRDVDGEL
jgi:4-hydroxy-tetrahydrodipicolinate reductase